MIHLAYYSSGIVPSGAHQGTLEAERERVRRDLFRTLGHELPTGRPMKILFQSHEEFCPIQNATLIAENVIVTEFDDNTLDPS